MSDNSERTLPNERELIERMTLSIFELEIDGLVKFGFQHPQGNGAVAQIDAAIKNGNVAGMARAARAIAEVFVQTQKDDAAAAAALEHQRALRAAATSETSTKSALDVILTAMPRPAGWPTDMPWPPQG